MKVQISTQLKGELFVRAKNKTFKSGTKINLTNEEFFDSFTQSLVSKGWLVPLESYEKEAIKIRKLRSKKKNPMVFQIIKRAINPNEVFSVTEEQFANSQIQQAIEMGHIVEEIEKNDNESKKDSANNEVKEKNKSKSIKRLAGDSKTDKKLDSKKSKNMENSHVYRPDNIEINEPPTMVVDNKNDDDIFVNLPGKTENNEAFIDQSKSEELSFVDEEQKMDRASKKRNSRKNNNEDVS